MLIDYNNKMKQELFLNSHDNTKIAINHFKAGHKAVVILSPGWFMTKDSKPFNQMAGEFSKDFDVIAMDFRGHGRSSGFYTFTAKEDWDIKTVVNYAKENYEKVFLTGFSLGAALVLIHCAIEQNVDKVIAVSAPHSFERIENHMWKKDAWSKTLKKLEVKRFLSIRPSIIMHKKIKPIDVVDKIKVPTLFIAGEKDPTVYPWHTKALYEKAICKKEFELFENCCHAEDLFLQSGNKFMSICKSWLSEPFDNNLSKPIISEVYGMGKTCPIEK